MIYVVDNEKYLNKKYHFDIVEPFSDNLNYKIIHVKHFENYIKHVIEKSNFLGVLVNTV